MHYYPKYRIILSIWKFLEILFLRFSYALLQKRTDHIKYALPLNSLLYRLNRGGFNVHGYHTDIINKFSSACKFIYLI